MQEILFGLNNLEKTLRGSSKVLLVCDSSYPFLNIKETIEAIKLPVVKFDDFSPNPLYESVCKGVKLFNDEKCDTILTVGGGSSIDVAKCIKLYCKMTGEDIFLNQPYEDTGIKLIAIPTTAGTGSESTQYAVIYYDGKKQSVTHASIIPDYAILEPKVLKTLPLYQKKCTMMDALCQGIESWWSVNSTDESKQYSKIAVETIMKHWREYVFENTEEAAEQIMRAANYAGRAICITQTTAPHAFSYKITSLYGLPHGHAVALCLPEIWTYMITHPDRCTDSRGNIYLDKIFSDIASAMGAGTVRLSIVLFRQMIHDMDLKKPMSLNKRVDIGILSNSVNPVRLKNSPVFLDPEAITGIYNIVVG